MTHEELLTKIDKLEILDNKSIRYATAGIKTPITADTPTNKVLAKTLRVVVELHKQVPGGGSSYPPGFPIADDCEMCQTNYPCSTIQAIEKELN